MRRSLTSLVVVGSIVVFAACGPNEEDQRKADQARRDSLAADLALREAASDTTQANGDVLGNGSALDIRALTFNQTGRFAVQVGAWRSETKAEELAQLWKRRGYANSSVHSYGDQHTGDVWFRVRLGRMPSRSEADALVNHIRSRHGLVAWVDTISTP